MSKEIRKFDVSVLIEADQHQMDRVAGYVVQALKQSCRHTRDGAVLIGVYDEDEQQIGFDITGSPGPKLQQQVEELFDWTPDSRVKAG